MKVLYAALVFVCFTSVSLAQKSFILQHQPKLGFVSASAGVSQPLGAFAGRCRNDARSGMAETGSAMALAAGWRFNGKVGMMGRVQQQINYMNRESVLAMPYIIWADTRVATTGKWTMTTALFGPYISLPMGRLSLDLRALTGPATAICPATSVDGYAGTMPVAVRSSQGQASAWAYSGGATLSYRLGRSLAAQLNADYSTAAFNFTDMTLTTQDGTRIQSSLVGGPKTIASLNVQAGLTFLFGNRFRPF